MAERKGLGLSSSFYSTTTTTLFRPLLPPFQNIPVTLLTYTDRLYLGCYTEKPTASTVFPYSQSQSQGSPSKRSQRAVDGPLAAPTKSSRQSPYYFSVDDTLLYNAFHHDFGPLHIGHLYRFALYFHDVLGAKENESRPIVFWSRADPKCMSCHSVNTI
ncbi:hypothetical protein RRF57_011547 [Xylaria bambusicola]|uniref:Dual specificity/tyrosine protein phosphatase N-terminal domain-containing protein n=1 Tax=Xylaria bambusicola TaxID=326684 RepID=A0AAN7UN06_9PEZI